MDKNQPKKHFVPRAGEDLSYELGAVLKKTFFDVAPPKTKGRIVKGVFVPDPQPDASPKTEAEQTSPQDVDPSPQ
jgi:hypothetical protein